MMFKKKTIRKIVASSSFQLNGTTPYTRDTRMNNNWMDDAFESPFCITIQTGRVLFLLRQNMNIAENYLID